MRRFNKLLLTLLVLAGLSDTEALAQGYPPQEAAGRMTVAEGFFVQLVASEPEVRQPILVKFDERGRLWTIQYLQYPNPAGLKRVQVDRWSRTVYGEWASRLSGYSSYRRCSSAFWEIRCCLCFIRWLPG